MRFLAFLLGGIGLFFLSGYLYLRRMGLDLKGTTIPQSISLAFVQRNMFRIADAEREELTAFSECDSIACDGGGTDFTVTGTHAPAPPGSPLRWPVLIIDQTMAFREVY
jgi:hypothetical protein